MNLEQLKAMSNAEINELCAIKVIGWEVRGTSTAYFILNEIVRTKEETSYGKAWNPTEDMNDAMQLLHKIKDEFDYICISYSSTYCEFSCDGYIEPTDDDEGKEFKGISETASLAVCYFALLAIGES